VFHDRTGTLPQVETTVPLSAFPSPARLWSIYRGWKGLTIEQEKVVLQDFFDDGGGREPRYYQRNAINASIEAIAKGQDRLLLVMATGTGKTYTAFQIIWRLWKAAQKKRVLYLADRNILIDQTMVNDFRPFGPAMAKLSPNPVSDAEDDTTNHIALALDRQRRIDPSYEVYLGLYQAITGPEERQKLFREFSPGFFDLIIIDECHRGSAADDAAWREIFTRPSMDRAARRRRRHMVLGCPTVNLPKLRRLSSTPVVANDGAIHLRAHTRKPELIFRHRSDGPDTHTVCGRRQVPPGPARLTTTQVMTTSTAITSEVFMAGHAAPESPWMGQEVQLSAPADPACSRRCDAPSAPLMCGCSGHKDHWRRRPTVGHLRLFEACRSCLLGVTCSLTVATGIEPSSRGHRIHGTGRRTSSITPVVAEGRTRRLGTKRGWKSSPDEGSESSHS